MNPLDDPAWRWQAEAACRDTVARAARLTDLQDHEGFVQLFTDDAALQRPAGEWLQGRAQILAAYRARPAQRITRHLIGGCVVDLLSPDEARVSTTVLLASGHADDAVGAFGRPLRGPLVVGEFDDLLRREADGGWRIARRRASFLLHTSEHEA